MRRDMLTIEYPELALEWDYEKNHDLNPSQINSGSHKNVWWRCILGHRWVAPIFSRTSGSGCPYCSNVKALKGYNDLLSYNPKLCLEWDNEKNSPLKPDEVTVYSHKNVWWKCVLGHSWQAVISSRSCGNGCPYCSGHKVLIGFNDLPTVRPQLIAEWDYTKNNALRPEQFSNGANKKIWWKCNLGHSWQAMIYTRSTGCGCPYCANLRVLKGFNDLLTVNSKLSEEWDYEKNDLMRPDAVGANSYRKAWWQCEKGHSWQALIYSRNLGNGCPYCANKKVLKGFNDLATTHPQLAAEWDVQKNGSLCPEKVTAQSNSKVWWICKRGHSYSAKINNRYNGRGCPYCWGRYPIIGENDLVTVNPAWLSEWDYEKNGSKKPESHTVGSSKKIWWKCKRGHRWETPIIARFYGGDCPYCQGQMPMRTRLVK